MDISVIIPTYNREKILETTLQSFLKLKCEKISYEIIIIDNNSDDETSIIIEKYKDILPIIYLFEEKPGKNNALNLGIRHSRGEILVFTDDDVLVDENWIGEIISSTLRFPGYNAFGGKILPQFPDGTPEWIKTSEYSPFVYAIHDPDQGEGEYLNFGTPGGPNCWVRRNVFESGHMYDADIGPRGCGRISGSELEFFTRLLKLGMKPVYIPTAVVMHRIQKFQTLKKYLIKRSYASGRGFVYINNDKKCHCLFGVPRYLFRQIIEATASALYYYAKLDIKSAFEKVMIVAHRIGCVKQYRFILLNNSREMKGKGEC